MRDLSDSLRRWARRHQLNPAIATAVAERLELPAPVVSRVFRVLMENIARFDRGGLYCFDDATAEDLDVLARESGESPERIARILPALDDAMAEWLTRR